MAARPRIAIRVSLGRFDLDHLGAHITEDLGGDRAEHIDRRINDTHSAKGTLGGGQCCLRRIVRQCLPWGVSKYLNGVRYYESTGDQVNYCGPPSRPRRVRAAAASSIRRSKIRSTGSISFANTTDGPKSSMPLLGSPLW